MVLMRMGSTLPWVGSIALPTEVWDAPSHVSRKEALCFNNNGFVIALGRRALPCLLKFGMRRDRCLAPGHFGSIIVGSALPWAVGIAWPTAVWDTPRPVPWSGGSVIATEAWDAPRHVSRTVALWFPDSGFGTALGW